MIKIDLAKVLKYIVDTFITNDEDKVECELAYVRDKFNINDKD
jgi:hypothetical protein